VRLWEVKTNGKTELKTQFPLEAPALSVAWSDDLQSVFTGGCDNKSFRWDLTTGKSVQIALHDQPIKYVKWIPDKRVLLTASWDKTIRYWDGRTAAPALNVPLPERVYCADVRDHLAVIGTAERHVLIYNLNNPQQPYRTMESPLKFQSRCIRCFPDKTGFALGSIEGRVAIHHVDAAYEAKNFAFKCHRIKNNVYAINDIAFHPLNTFATAGSDGSFNLWDKDSKQRLKALKPCSLPITCCEWNTEGTIFAYSVCYDWSRGAGEYNPATMKSHILLHSTSAEEVRPRPAQAGTVKKN